MVITKDQARQINGAMATLQKAGLDIRMSIRGMQEPVLISIPQTVVVFVKKEGEIHLHIT